MNWKTYFKPTAKCPAKLVLADNRKLDFTSDKTTDDIIASMLEVAEGNLPYLEITDAGKEKFYGIKPKKPVTTGKHKKKSLK